MSLHVDLQNWSCLLTIFQKLHGHDSSLDVDSLKEKALFDSIYMQLSSGWVGCAVADCQLKKEIAHMNPTPGCKQRKGRDWSRTSRSKMQSLGQADSGGWLTA